MYVIADKRNHYSSKYLDATM